MDRFINHELIVEADTELIKSFYCRNKNGSKSYEFRATFAPNFIAIFGECGELILTPNIINANALEWLIANRKDPVYLSRKSPFLSFEKRENKPDLQLLALQKFCELYYENKIKIL
ncbi:hypothetical protein ACWNT8_15460 (plasmid) [Pigmentibacter ruber]